MDEGGEMRGRGALGSYLYGPLGSYLYIIHLRAFSQRKRSGGKQAGLPMGSISSNIFRIRFSPLVLPCAFYRLEFILCV